MTPWAEVWHEFLVQDGTQFAGPALAPWPGEPSRASRTPKSMPPGQKLPSTWGSPDPVSPEQSSVLAAWEVAGGLRGVDCSPRQRSKATLSRTRWRSQAGTGCCKSFLCTSRTMRIVSAKLSTRRAMQTTK